jgi:hypothetical protein
MTRAYFDYEKHLERGCTEIRNEILRSQIYDKGTRQEFADVVCDTVELCVVITDILLLVFPVNREVSTSAPEACQNGEQALTRWYLSSGRMQYQSEKTRRNPSVTVTASLMLMCYQYESPGDWPAVAIGS